MESVLGYEVVGDDSQLEELIHRWRSALITVGQIKSPLLRRQLFELVQSMGALLPVIVSKNAYASRHAEIGAGSIVMHGVTVNAGAQIGVNCIINSHALIEHDARVGSHAHVSTGARLNGGVLIGSDTFVGSGAVINQGITVGSECIVGSGSVIRGDIPDGSEVRGQWP